jgi:hypothetical protein
MKAKPFIFLTVSFLILNLMACSSKKDVDAAKRGDASDKAGETADKKGVAEKDLGWLQIKNADLKGQEVRKADSGEEVERVTSLRSTVELPAGMYSVTFGKAIWKGVEVRAKETTVLEPGALVVNHASLSGHDVIQAETDIIQGTVSVLNNNITLIPGKYIVKFGKLAWPVEIKAGLTTTINPGTVEVVRAHFQGHKIYSKAGEVVGEVSNIQSLIPLPPGEYEIEIGGKKLSFALKEGENLKFENKSYIQEKT